MILVKVPQRLDADAAGALRKALGAVLDDAVVSVFAAVELDESYVYCDPGDDPGDGAAAACAEAAGSVVPGSTARKLTSVQLIPGASAGEDAPWHYVVETDVADGGEPEVVGWYNEEHMPGLASVPGTVRAERFASDEGWPRFHACYDLRTPDTLGSPAWLAVRETEWSDRARPLFRNTKRTMFSRVQ